MTDAEHSIAYRDALGQTVLARIPWALGIGLIPPPELVFIDGETGARLVFVYAGSVG